MTPVCRCTLLRSSRIHAAEQRISPPMAASISKARVPFSHGASRSTAMSPADRRYRSKAVGTICEDLSSTRTEQTPVRRSRAPLLGQTIAWRSYGRCALNSTSPDCMTSLWSASVEIWSTTVASMLTSCES